MPPKKRPKTENEVRRAVQDASSPVLVVENHSPSVLDITSESLFADMISPISPSVFMECCLRKKALLVSAVSSEQQRIQPILQAMNNLDPSFILQETSSDNVFVWILDQNNHKIQSVEIDNVETAIALHKAGHATYCRAPPDVEQPMVAQLLRGTGMGCGQYDPSATSQTCMGRGEVEVFMGTSQHTTDWHYDFQENFTLQLSGNKKWTLQQGTVAHPLRGCTPHYNAPNVVESQLKAAHLGNPKFQFGTPQVGVNAFGSQVQVIVKPGDVLYFPAGMWHKVETLEAGVSINVSLMATNYALLATQALQHFLLQKDEWRQCVVGNDGALSHLQYLLQQLPSEIENLTKLNFAEQILPPVVRNPPRLELVDENNVAEEEEEPAVLNEHDQAMEENGGTAVDDDEDDNEEEEIVDIHEFESPASMQLPPQEGFLVANSMASLVKMSDITSFYSGSDDKENDASHLYVLNVNYAGNEIHESVVRVILKDSTDDCLKTLVDGEPRQAILYLGRAECEVWLQCLMYYGFLVWIPTEDLSRS